MRVTQKTIAASLGVSVSLVSRVLSGTATEIGIPPATIEQVKRRAAELGYVPNVAAQALKGKPSRFIGVVVYDFKDPFFAELVATIQEKFHRIGYSTLLVGFTDRQIDERDLSPLKQHNLDAIIVLGSDLSGAFQKEIKDTPIFRIGHAIESEDSISFYPDENEFAHQLSLLLQSYSAHEVAILQSDLPNHDIRRNAIASALEGAAIRFTIHPLEQRPYFEAGYHWIQRILKEGKLPDAIACTTDQLALGVTKALLENEIDIPGDVRVTGFDDIPMAGQFHPGLTTFRQPVGAIIDKIIERLKTSEFSPSAKPVQCPLVRRASC
jgi:DNA-binding LacI/PurR family transcriptional regulator